MDSQNATGWTTGGRWAAAVMAVSATLAWSLPAAAQETDPTSIGAGQRPYVMVLMDTSGSMEWTDAGDLTYPTDTGVSNVCDKTDQGHSAYQSWKSGCYMGVDGNDPDGSGPQRFGPCFVWEARCNDYERPAFMPIDDWHEKDHLDTGTPMRGRVNDMRGKASALDWFSRDPVRMHNTSQPRHVSLKEILTGDMILYPLDGTGTTLTSALSDMSSSTYGPGCWFVPRFRTASAEHQVCESDLGRFKKLPDNTSAVPHFQEVYDVQKTNGFLDLMSNSAIFGVTMFDGYKREPQEGWRDHLDDDVDDGSFKGWDEESTQVVNSTTGNSEDVYNLGVYRVISPKRMNIPAERLKEISDFAQVTLADAGWVAEKTGSEWELDNDDDADEDTPWLNVEFDRDLKDFMEKYDLAKQPIAQATPLAAAMYDIHNFFAEGAHGEEPILDDPYMQCRPKNVIMLTDGFPEPEAPNAKTDVGTDALTPAYGYSPDLYLYDHAEREITDFVTDSTNAGYLVDDPAKAYKYDPRVHIVALSIQDLPTDQRNDVLYKMALMAIEGNSCAGYYLPNLIQDPTTQECDPTNPSLDCGCDPASGDVCLAKEQAEVLAAKGVSYTSFQPPDGDGSTLGYACRYPALILTDNDQAAMTSALQQLFNFILKSAGTASRTVVSVANQLDDPDLTVNGQHRVLSGMAIDGTNPYWKGLLFRETLLCSDSAGDVAGRQAHPLHEDVQRLTCSASTTNLQTCKDEDASQGDRRRVFTSVASPGSFDYTTMKAKPITDTGVIRGRFTFGFDLQLMSSNGEFQSTYLTQRLKDDDYLLHARVPFEYNTLREVYESSTGAPFDSTAMTIESYFDADDQAELEEMIHTIRGRTSIRRDRVLGGIYNANPVSVGMPELDLPIDSYRKFRESHDGRVAVTYVQTIDGMLHALYTGEEADQTAKNNQVLVRPSPIDPSAAGSGAASEQIGSMFDQREAWAYVPQILHRRFGEFKDRNIYLADGSPVVQDVRLCNADPQYNQNKQACRVACESCGTIEPDVQWRTVLVAGLGSAGAGYYALDITRPGGEFAGTVRAPDPIPLWEFDPNWERGQVEWLIDNGQSNLVMPNATDGSPRDGGFINACSDDPTSPDYFWKQPFLGASVAEPAIGEVIVASNFGDNEPHLRRPVALLAGGQSDDYGTPCDINERSGRALYLVDMQTGTLLRRFVDYQIPAYLTDYDNNNSWQRFDASLIGTPMLYNDKPGSVATRAFVGDAKGRLFRLDMSSPDPTKWKVELFFDPAQEGGNGFDESADYAPATYQPAAALDKDRSLIIVYGLGTPGDTVSGDQKQHIIALKEKIEANPSDPTDFIAKREFKWTVPFDEYEKLTGEPTIFNGDVYFTTYRQPDDDLCTAGTSRIYGLELAGDLDSNNRPLGVFDRNDPDFTSADVEVDPDASHSPAWWFGPTQKTLIRGLKVTLGPNCSIVGDDTSGYTQFENAGRQPQLIAQTGSVDAGMGNSVGDSSGNVLNKIEKSVKPPQSTAMPLSWTVVGN